MYAPRDLTHHHASKSPAIPSSRGAPTTSGSAAANRKSTSSPTSAFLVCALLLLVGAAERVNAGTFLSGNKLFFKNEAPDGQNEVTRASLGQSVVLECEAGGSPSPTLHWLRNGQRIHQGNGNSWTDDEAEFETPTNSVIKPSLQLSLTRSRLFIDCLSASTAGEYECVAETPARRITKQFYVEISDVLPNDARTVGCLKRNVDHPARVYMWTSHRIELEGADVQLFCRADGEPSPVVTWYDRDDSVITEDDSSQFKLLENGDLLIRKVNWKDNMGLYRCVAGNEQGSDSVHIFLYPTKAK